MGSGSARCAGPLLVLITLQLVAFTVEECRTYYFARHGTKTICLDGKKPQLRPNNQQKKTPLKVKVQVKKETLLPLNDLYREMIKGLELPSVGQNLFVDLAEKIARELNITRCWVCGGPQMAEEWPWRGTSLSAKEILKGNYTFTNSKLSRPGGWVLSSTVFGEDCLQRTGARFTQTVGDTPCRRILSTNSTSSGYLPQAPESYWSRNNDSKCIWDKDGKLYKCQRTKMNPFSGVKEISKFWENINNTSKGFWKAPDGLFWICGDKAHAILPNGWKGSCTLGIIQPGFFLLPLENGDELGVPVYDNLKREKRDVQVGGTQRWGDEEWPPERIIETYGPATWAQDGSWGYRTPIYMLNRIIRLQAVVEIITNQTARGLELIAQQQTQSRAAIYQNRLALDYLLAEEGGVCGKFNTSDCCLQIDDNGEAIKNIASNIRKIAHVPVQKWESMLDGKWWNDFFGGTWWKQAGFILLCAISGLLFLPCLIPCFIRLISSVVQGMQLTAMPMDPKAATAGSAGAQKIMVLRPAPKQTKDMEKAKRLLLEWERSKKTENMDEVLDILAKWEQAKKNQEKINV